MGYDWIKLYTTKWLFGSGRTMSPDKRGVWTDLLALAAECKLRDGILRFDIGQPMSRDYITGILQIPRDLLDVCLEAFAHDINTDDGKPRIKIWEDGTIELTNFSKYQDVPDGKKKLEGRELELYQRQQLNKLAAKFPIEAINVPEVKDILQGELDNEKTTTEGKS